MNYNNYENPNNDGHSRLPKPTYSGTLSDGYDESKVKRQKTECIHNPSFPSNLYSSPAYYESSWNSGYNSQQRAFTHNNQFFHPSPQPTQYNFPNLSTYTQNGVPPGNGEISYRPSPDLPKRSLPYAESAPALKSTTDYRTSISYEHVSVPIAKKTYSFNKEDKGKDTPISEPKPMLPGQSSATLKSTENPKKNTASSCTNTQNNYNVEPEEEDCDDPPEAEGSAKVVLVPGTSIALITDEDIKKWRDERKKMWLLKISNNKKEHMQSMGIKEDELKGQPSILRESRKEKQFIQSIQNQVQRGNPRVDLNLKLIQREFANENSQLLDFICELGDAGLLECELTQEEKDVLFGTSEDKNRNNYKPNYRNRKTNLNRGNFTRYK
ncbi:rsa1p [Saccharomyces arboricola H-6]|uniref:Rsa1p n=1 Tax=Saccharomyces arboricola (strain H-6 / AS 2.3317 / CBS 10644) TaxID=1160507 RepID=J8Q1E1_SACAR|nr:rsa1p [Saccharomyces arboricola H-6]